MVSVRAAGQYLDITVGAVGDLAWEHHWPVGSWAASWRMDLPATFTHPLVKANARVELMEGAARVWQGVMTKPVYDGTTWAFTAVGLGRLAENFLCFGSTGNTLSDPDSAISRAILRGLPWVSTLAGTDPITTTDTNGLNYLDDLLNEWTDDEGTRWAVDPDGNFYAQPDPTTPTLHLVPGAGTLGVADEDTATRLFGRYRDTATTYATVDVADIEGQLLRGYREDVVDLTNLGVITEARALKRINGLLTKGASQPAWTNGLEVAYGELTNAGGEPVHLAYVGMRPELVRLHGVINPVTNRFGYIDFPAGEVHHKNGVPYLGMLPLGAVKGTTLRSALSATRSTGWKG